MSVAGARGDGRNVKDKDKENNDDDNVGAPAAPGSRSRVESHHALSTEGTDTGPCQNHGIGIFCQQG